jgi:hypothetical protein
MAVIFAQTIAHDAGALAMRLVRRHAQLLHGEQYAPLHRLQPILHAGDGALQDHVLGVGHHAAVQHFLKGGLDDFGRTDRQRILRHQAAPLAGEWGRAGVGSFG